MKLAALLIVWLILASTAGIAVGVIASLILS